MADLEFNLQYRFDMVDNVTPTSRKGMTAQKELQTTLDQTHTKMMEQTTQFISNVMALSALEGGVNALAESFVKLGIVTDEGAEKMRMVAAGVKLFTGSAQIIQGLVGVMNLLRTTEIGLAVVETFRSVLANPAKMALIGVGLGTAAGVGYWLGSEHGGGGGGGGGTSVTQNITFTNASGSDARGTARESLEIMGGY